MAFIASTSAASTWMSAPSSSLMNRCGAKVWNARRPRCCAVVASGVDSDIPNNGGGTVNRDDVLREIRKGTCDELASHGLGIVTMNFTRGILNVSVSSLDDIANVPGCSGATLDDTVRASRIIGDYIDSSSASDLVSELGENYSLEVATPGTRDVITKDREMEAFKSFPVRIATTEEYKGKRNLEGTLIGRDASHVKINVKGRPVKIPREIVAEVRLVSAKL